MISLQEKDYILEPVQVFYLEMHNAPNFALPQKEEVTFIKLEKPIDVTTYKHYYYNVGFQFNWLDRLAMSDEELSEKVNADNVEIFILKVNNDDAGYIEFIIEKDFVEILYFGLFPQFLGKGLGKFFLQWVVNKAWNYKPKWIELNTCKLDHPNALSVYQSVGFSIVKTETHQRKILAEKSSERTSE